MTLVDTSVWVDHLRDGFKPMARLLEAGQVLMHPFILGEIALGMLSPRSTILRDLSALPTAVVATDREVLEMIETNRLFGSGVGYVDAHLIAATRLTQGATIWTRDGRLERAARALALAFSP